MIKVIEDKTRVRIDFLNDASDIVSGELLTYEVCGDACVLFDNDRIWVPFSRLTKASQKRLMTSGAKTKTSEKGDLLKDPKLCFFVTGLVLIIYGYIQNIL